MIADRNLWVNWVTYLLREQIPFFLRLPKHYWFTVNGVELKPKTLLQSQKCKLDNVSVLGMKGLRI